MLLLNRNDFKDWWITGLALSKQGDATNASPNGLKSTHALALLLTQVQENTNEIHDLDNSYIRRLGKEELKEEPSQPVEV